MVDRVAGKGATGFGHARVDAHLAIGRRGRAKCGDRRGGGRPRGAEHGDAAANRIVGRSVENTVLVAVHIIARRVNALVAVKLEVGVTGIGGAGTGDEIVSHDVVGKDPARVSYRIGRLKVVNNIVDVLGVGFGQGLAVVRADPEVAVEGVRADLHMGAELLADGVGDDAILHGEIGRAHGVDAVELPVFKRAMVQDDIAPIPHVQRAFAGVRVLVALAEADIADDDVALVAQRHFGGHHADASPGGCLALDREVAAHRNRGQEDDVSAHVENDDAVARAHRVPEGPRARIVQVGHMVNRPAPTAGGRGSESEGSREGRDLCPRRRGWEGKEQSKQGERQNFKR